MPKEVKPMKYRYLIMPFLNLNRTELGEPIGASTSLREAKKLAHRLDSPDSYGAAVVDLANGTIHTRYEKGRMIEQQYKRLKKHWQEMLGM
jgi:hypothetical protein